VSWFNFPLLNQFSAGKRSVYKWFLELIWWRLMFDSWLFLVLLLFWPLKSSWNLICILSFWIDCFTPWLFHRDQYWALSLVWCLGFRKIALIGSILRLFCLSNIQAVVLEFRLPNSLVLFCFSLFRNILFDFYFCLRILPWLLDFQF
jgi:hypothetical protein